MSKSGKLRSLVRELKKTYSDAATRECLDKKNVVHSSGVVWIILVNTHVEYHVEGSPAGCQSPCVKLASICADCRCLKTLEHDIVEVDKHYDRCNDAWAKGEVADFGSEESLG